MICLFDNHKKLTSSSLKYFSIINSAFLYTSSFSWFCNFSRRSMQLFSSNTRQICAVPLYFSANSNIFNNPAKTTFTVRASFESIKWQNGIKMLNSPTSLITCSGVPLVVVFVTTQAASFWDLKSPFSKIVRIIGRMSPLMTCSIWSELPAVMLLMVQAASFTILDLEFWSSFLRGFNAPAARTASVYKEQGKSGDDMFY